MRRRGFGRLDRSETEILVKKVIEGNPKVVEDYHKKKKRALNFWLGG
jgi:GatB domain.